MPLPSESAEEPRALGRYELLRPLAKGGMAQLHLARFASIEGFEKLAVIKRLKPEHAERPDVVQMFLSEVRLLANMQHPNIVHVYDVGAEAGAYWFAMEFLHGQDLRALLRKTGRRIPLEHALTVVTATLAGLHYVHERKDPGGTPLGIVHRDVSPPNVFITYDGNVKLLDFGIAKIESSQQTQAGVLKGKVRYMAPEQVNSQPIDRRADVFAAGIVLWELTVGRRLFDGKTDVEVLLQISTQQPTYPSVVRADYPAALERIVMRALAREPADRYQTARELQQDLENYARDARMTLSPNNLEAYMATVFADDIEAWQRAQREGKALSDHLNEQMPNSTGTFPSSSQSQSVLSSGSQSSQFSAPSGMRKKRGGAWVAIAALAAVGVLGAVGVVVATHHGAAPESIGPDSAAAIATTASTEPKAAAATAPVIVAEPSAITPIEPAPHATATPLHAQGHYVWHPSAPKKNPTDVPPSDTKPPSKPTWDKDSPLPPP